MKILYNFVLLEFNEKGNFKVLRKFFTLGEIYEFFRNSNLCYSDKLDPKFLDFYRYKIITYKEYENIYKR